MLEDYRDIGEEQGAVVNTVRREGCGYGGGTGSCIELSNGRGVWDIGMNGAVLNSVRRGECGI